MKLFMGFSSFGCVWKLGISPDIPFLKWNNIMINHDQSLNSLFIVRKKPCAGRFALATPATLSWFCARWRGVIKCYKPSRVSSQSDDVIWPNPRKFGDSQEQWGNRNSPPLSGMFLFAFLEHPGIPVPTRNSHGWFPPPKNVSIDIYCLCTLGILHNQSREATMAISGWNWGSR